MSLTCDDKFTPSCITEEDQYNLPTSGQLAECWPLLLAGWALNKLW